MDGNWKGTPVPGVTVGNGSNTIQNTTSAGCNGGCQISYTPLAPLPNEGDNISSLPAFLSYLFPILIVLGGLIGVGTFVVYGILYMVSEVPGVKSNARNRMWASVYGLLILLASVLILNTINPDLTKFDLTTLGKAAQQAAQAGSQDGVITQSQPLQNTGSSNEPTADSVCAPFSASGDAPGFKACTTAFLSCDATNKSPDFVNLPMDCQTQAENAGLANGMKPSTDNELLAAGRSRSCGSGCTLTCQADGGSITIRTTAEGPVTDFTAHDVTCVQPIQTQTQQRTPAPPTVMQTQDSNGTPQPLGGTI